jgi:hypothetical protein
VGEHETQLTGTCKNLWAQYNANNQVGAVVAPGGGAVSPSPYAYDAAGDVTMDMTKGNQYLYDAEGRIWRVAPVPVSF